MTVDMSRTPLDTLVIGGGSMIRTIVSQIDRGGGRWKLKRCWYSMEILHRCLWKTGEGSERPCS